MNPDPISPLSSVLEKGRNCGHVSVSNRGAILVDGEAYFRDLFENLERARRSIFIIGWDFDSRMRLVKEHGAPPLGEFLNGLVSRREDLHIRILIWDYNAFYAPGREPLPRLTYAPTAHRRVQFRLDSHHPFLGSHHQKIVVVDDLVAFCGGMDLGGARWDTPTHRPDDPGRRNPRGEAYPPVHDVQMRVEGPAAAELGRIARERWFYGTGEFLSSPDIGASKQTKRHGSESRVRGRRREGCLEFYNGTVGVSRTVPAHMEIHEIREIERLYLDLIEAAQSYLYFENQYFACQSIASRLCESLARPDGPEVVIVLPSKQEAWLEDRTMGAIRNKVLARLKDADRHGRLGIFIPRIKGLREGLNVHSKVLVVDDRYAMVGSANINNRSMGFDTECNLTLDAGDDPELRRVVAAFRSHLLAEHAGASYSTMAGDIEATGSLLKAAKRRRRGPKRLYPYRIKANDWIQDQLTDLQVVDPSRAFTAERQFDTVLGALRYIRPAPFGRVCLIFGAVLGTMWLLASISTVLWEWGLVGEPWFQALAQPFASREVRILSVGLAFAAAALLFVPLNLVILATATVTDFWPAILVSTVGALSNAALGYGLGRLFGPGMVGRFAFSNVDYIARRLGSSDLLSVLYTRVLFWFPNSFVNLAAGATGAGLMRFLVGSLFGLLPGILTISLFQNRLKAFVLGGNVVDALLVITVGVAVLVWTRTWRRRYGLLWRAQQTLELARKEQGWRDVGV